MLIENTIEGFYESVKKAGKLLEHYQKSMDEKQSSIQKCVEQISEVVVHSKDSENELERICNQLLIQYNKGIFSWKQAVDKYISGKEFVNKFEKSLLLIVFADVKAGKSTLGNFISGYAFKGTPYEYLFSNPTCYAYDYTDKSLNCGEETVLKEGYFKEDEIQATASIQYFTLYNGLTWVDTPGIHSLTTEYEALAKDYVKYADLILFLTPSNNPMKQDESVEITKLIKCDKPLMITITKSDKTELRIENGKRVMALNPKDKDTRASQEKYVEEQIKEMGKGSIVSQNRYISISTKIAKKALAEQDEELFQASNFPDFFSQIGSVISEKAIELKMKRPKDALNAVIDELISGNDSEKFIGIHQMQANISNTIKTIEKQVIRLERLKGIILSNVQSEVSNRIYSLLYSEKLNAKLSDNDYIAEKISALINEVASREIMEIISTEISNFQYVQLENAHIVVHADFQTKKQKIEYQIQEGSNRRRDPHGIIEHIQSWFGKEFTEYSVRNIKKTREIEVGDNFNEYSKQVWNSVQPQIKEIVDVEIAKVNQQYFGTLRSSMESILEQLQTIEKQLQNLKY